MAKYLQVVFNIPVKATYTYENLETDGEFKDYFGCRVEARLGNRKLIGFVIGGTEEKPEGFTIKPILRVVDDTPLYSEKLLGIAKWMADFTMCSVGEALSTMLPGGKKEKGLPDTGVEDIPDPKDITLSDEQSYAINSILGREIDSVGNRSESGEVLQSGGQFTSSGAVKPSGFYYLFGITGSGKTEVFLQVAKEVLNRGEAVIYLVPEISLTHQVVDTLKTRFTQGVAVLHSHLTPSQKLKEWRRIQSGEALLIIGARSAIFAPCDRLGLIIIDEEHENSYKAGNTPRYSARQVAMKRAQIEGAKLVMGSATPSIESWKLMEDGRITRLNLTKRLSGGAVPRSVIIDMKKEQGVLSKHLIDKIKETKELGRQTILFLNRRGFSYFYHCNSCGYEMVCRNCSVAMTYHKQRNRMICHYCGYQTPPVQICPECNSLDISSTGFGTEHIEEEINKIFPNYTIARLDSDTVTKKTVLKQTLSSFKRGEIDILLGTQMVARGLNFPGVKLVGVILADTGLKMPDFRAEERTFSLIVQVAGRAGRYAPDGEVVIQTFMPKNRAINHAAKSNLLEYYKEELETREFLEFPPFSRMIRLVFRSKRLNDLLQSITHFRDELERRVQDHAEILGPSECPISLMSGNHRHQLIIRTSNLNRVHGLTYSLLQQFKVPSHIYIEIDVDPITLL